MATSDGSVKELIKCVQDLTESIKELTETSRNLEKKIGGLSSEIQPYPEEKMVAFEEFVDLDPHQLRELIQQVQGKKKE